MPDIEVHGEPVTLSDAEAAEVAALVEGNVVDTETAVAIATGEFEDIVTEPTPAS